MRIGITAAAAAAVSVAVVAASAPASTSKLVPFTASYSGTAVVKVTDNVADIVATGTGAGTLLPNSKISGHGTGDSSQQPCVPFTGPGSIVSANGTKLFFTVLTGSRGCGDEQGQVFSVVGKAKVTKTTGKLLKARGTLKITGVYDRGAGTFSIKFKGTLTK
jgi:hypothetical protein